MAVTPEQSKLKRALSKEVKDRIESEIDEHLTKTFPCGGVFRINKENCPSVEFKDEYEEYITETYQKAGWFVYSRYHLVRGYSYLFSEEEIL